ncbi:alkylhydroperoxidase AhpD family core domain-containing protein [Lentzea albidocapillata subsp. violacea]|uniref:Alkylhydroperoxidase AhpD family core domain-containing protein n=1 Tax=Lentzea albidocapillata subsp. violacea TaxID=128104 RepID=A0A1H0AFM0_9PSEU|nr:carboxymuconolactone decarboxylase family protein [Lentzea albidocapillata]SDN32360.1 alkylhydroperoxidase AhpD family core domain-containing protein [Lentzea albidocapillata subsp. violacea]
MPRFPVHAVDDAPEASRESLRKLQTKFGKVLNIHGEMAHAPVVLAAYTGIQQAIAEHGSFDARIREAIALAVGAVDNCAYCQSAHTAAGRQAGWSLEQTIALRGGKQIDGEDKLGTLLAVARQIAGNVGEVDEGTWQQALQAGWAVGELSELFTHVVANLFTNYFNHYAHTELDIPAAPGLAGGTV